MKHLTTLLMLCAALALAGCSVGSENSPQGVASVEQPAAGGANASTTATYDAAPATQSAPAAPGQPAFKAVSLAQADAAQPAPAERKIIRNAELTLVAEHPSEAVRRVASLVEARGGFVVTSDARQQGNADGAYEVVTIEVRVPAAQFDAVVGEIRGVGGRVAAEKITGRDVTEEYIDLEARARTQRALEAQFLEIMKGAESVTEALEVQRELANVRGEIERVEGRRRFLENQASLSTIKVTLQPSAPFVSTTGFGHSLREALGDGVDAAAAITLGLVRVLIALVPVALFLGLPLFLLVRYALRRARRRAPPAEQLP